MKRAIFLFAAPVALGFCVGAASAQTLKTVKDRGALICGVSQGLPGFSNPDDKGNWTGFDVDFCRAIAAAIFNDPSKVKFTPLSAKDRFEPLKTGDIDLFYDVNQEFHEAIYDASRNAYAADQTRKLRNQVAAYRRRVTRMPSRIADTVREHEAIMQAILAHDPERAHCTMRDHVNLLGDNLLDFLAAFK